MTPQRTAALWAAASSLAAGASAQPGPSAQDLFKSNDLVCVGLLPNGNLECQLRPKAAVVAADAAAVPPAPPPAATPKAADAEAPKKQSFVEALTQIGQVDLSVPDSPAFAVLGISPSEVQRPGTVRELGSALVRSLDKNGKPKTGVAVDFAPLPLFAQQMIRGGKPYADNPWLQAFTRTTVSLASTTGDSDGSSQLAWGVRMGVFDFGDPGLHYKDLLGCVKLTVPPPKIKPGPTVEGLSAEEQAKLDAGIAACDPAKRLALWARPALYVGFGQSWYSTSGGLRDKSPATKAAWATFSQGIDRGEDSVRALFQAHASRKLDERTPDPADATQRLRQNTSSLIGRLRAGKDKWHAFLDLGLNRVKLGGTSTQNIRHTGVGAEFKLSDDIWLQLGGVSERGWRDGTTQNRVTTGIRFGSEPFLDVPGNN